MSSTALFLANAVLTAPFGILGLVAPGFAFGQFGLAEMDQATKTLIRGYASACLGYACVMFQLRSTTSANDALVFASTVFNVAETLLQAHALWIKAGFNNMVWTTLLSHFFLAVWSLRSLTTRSKTNHKD